MDPAEAKRIAELSSPHDPQQAAITEAALREVGEGVVTVCEVAIENRPVKRLDDEGKEVRDPRWQAFRNGNPISFAGLFIYGGETREEALTEARRIASKWDWPVEDSEAGVG